MDKPVSILINEFKTNIEKAINDAKLPPAVIEPILKDYYIQVQGFARQQLIKDMAAMQKESEKDAKNA